MKRRKKKQNKPWLIIILLGIICSVFSTNIQGSFSKLTDETLQDTESTATQTQTVDSSTEPLAPLKVYFLDVGQADAILIQEEDKNMLIDAGNNNDGPLLVAYFQSLGITSFQYVVGTHPHEDHIGGLAAVINSFEIEKVYIPDAITTTKTFENLLDALETQNLTYTVPTIGETFTLNNATLEVLYTGTNTSDLNNTSIVLKMKYGNNSFLFTGDATSTTEKYLIEKDIQAEVLKVGHHGSKYSSTEEFLDKVNPTYAIISVGQNNSYDHPSQSTITKLENRNIEIYRTDELGTILVTSDGQEIQISYLETNTNGG